VKFSTPNPPNPDSGYSHLKAIITKQICINRLIFALLTSDSFAMVGNRSTSVRQMYKCSILHFSPAIAKLLATSFVLVFQFNNQVAIRFGNYIFFCQFKEIEIFVALSFQFFDAKFFFFVYCFYLNKCS